MSKYEQLTKKEPKNFKRLIGVNKETFKAMIDVFKSYEDERTKSHGIGGRKSLQPEQREAYPCGISFLNRVNCQ